MIQKFRLPIETLVQRIVELKDLTDLDSGVDNLVASCPTAEEISQMQGQLNNEPNVEKYAKPEQYVIKLIAIPKVNQRLRNW